MDGAAVETILGAAKKPALLEIAGTPFLTVPPGWTVKDPHPQPAALALNTLTGLVDYVNKVAIVDGLDGTVKARIFLQVVSHREVRVLSGLDESYQTRDVLAVATAEQLFADRFKFEAYLSAETFIIGLQANFAKTKERDELLALVGNIREQAVKNTDDDGVSQTVTAKQGVSLATEAKLPNPVTLVPYRTFREVGQPESTFILRAQGSDKTQEGKPSLALFEADGGAWKLVAMQRVREYLTKAIKDVPVLA